MSSRKWTIGFIVSAVAAALLVAAAWTVSGFATTPTTTSSSASTTTTTPKSYDYDPGVSLEKVVVQLLHDAGFNDGEFVIGEKKFDLSLPAVTSAGSGSFAARPITSSEELRKFLTGGSVEANRVIRRVMDSTGAEKSVVVDVNNWIGVQFLIPTDWSGNTYFKDGTIVPAGEVRHSEKGDIAWFFVDPEDLRTGRIIVAESLLVLRGPCGNPQTVPPTPPSPPSTTTTTKPGTTTSTKPGTTSTTQPGSTTTTQPGTTSTTKPTTSTTKPSTTTTRPTTSTTKATTTTLKPKDPNDTPTRPTVPATTTTTAKVTTTATTQRVTTTTPTTSAPPPPPPPSSTTTATYVQPPE